ncbi:MAG: hypothetical protein M3416_12770 [Acidobacteriota bacterium]|nr:hypothetical protein [Acidobacteriota bacterium]
MKQQFCSSISQDINQDQLTFVMTQVASEAIVSAWRDCMRAKINSGNLASEILGEDEPNFVFKLRWGGAGGVPVVRVKNFTVIGAVCSPNNLRVGTRITTGWVGQSCRRRSNGSVALQITLNVANASQGPNAPTLDTFTMNKGPMQTAPKLLMTETFSVDSRADCPLHNQGQWLDTRMPIKIGNRIKITASGQISMDINNPSNNSTPDGPTGGLAEQGIVYGALVYGIATPGTSPISNKAGTSLTKIATQNGNLYLGMWDVWCADNRGSYTVTVEVFDR